MLRKIINFIVVLAIIVAISGIFIHLYNNSRKGTHNFDATNKISSSKSSKKKKKTNNDEQSIIKKKDNEDSSEESEDNDVVDDSNEQGDVLESDESTVSGSEVAVASTGTKENVYIAIVGAVIVITGTGIILKTNKDRV